MGKVEKIEYEVEALSPQELEEFRQWYFEFDGRVWDRQIESDVNSGKLDHVADEALKSMKSGKANGVGLQWHYLKYKHASIFPPVSVVQSSVAHIATEWV